jgi:hypothetical protein
MCLHIYKTYKTKYFSISKPYVIIQILVSFTISNYWVFDIKLHYWIFISNYITEFLRVNIEHDPYFDWGTKYLL